MSRALVDDAVVEGRSREKLLDFSPLLTTESMKARLAQKIPLCTISLIVSQLI